MIAKVIAYGADREIARRRLVRALQNSMIIGLQTNRDFLIDALERSDFIDGQQRPLLSAMSTVRPGLNLHLRMRILRSRFSPFSIRQSRVAMAS